MKWNKYRLKTTTQASDFVCSILIDLGITGMEVEDNIQLTEEEKKAQFIDYLADLPEDLEATARFRPRVAGIEGAIKQAELRLPPV